MLRSSTVTGVYAYPAFMSKKKSQFEMHPKSWANFWGAFQIVIYFVKKINLDFL